MYKLRCEHCETECIAELEKGKILSLRCPECGGKLEIVQEPEVAHPFINGGWNDWLNDDWDNSGKILVDEKGTGGTYWIGDTTATYSVSF